MDLSGEFLEQRASFGFEVVGKQDFMTQKLQAKAIGEAFQGTSVNLEGFGVLALEHVVGCKQAWPRFVPGLFLNLGASDLDGFLVFADPHRLLDRTDVDELSGAVTGLGAPCQERKGKKQAPFRRCERPRELRHRCIQSSWWEIVTALHDRRDQIYCNRFPSWKHEFVPCGWGDEVLVTTVFSTTFFHGVGNDEVSQWAAFCSDVCTLASVRGDLDFGCREVQNRFCWQEARWCP